MLSTSVIFKSICILIYHNIKIPDGAAVGLDVKRADGAIVIGSGDGLFIATVGVMDDTAAGATDDCNGDPLVGINIGLAAEVDWIMALADRPTILQIHTYLMEKRWGPWWV